MDFLRKRDDFHSGPVNFYVAFLRGCQLLIDKAGRLFFNDSSSPMSLSLEHHATAGMLLSPWKSKHQSKYATQQQQLWASEIPEGSPPKLI